ncbi:MAG: zinc-binding dehydrogenase [Mycobacterium sp.]
MRAIQAVRYGGPEVLEVVELPDPVPGPGQISIDVSHAAVGLIDLYLRRGQFADRDGLPKPPYVPGLEVVGTVRALGDDVDGFRIGEQVVTLSVSGEGGYGSISVCDARLVASIDGSGIDPVLAVAALPNAVTAQLALTMVTHLAPGESVLIHGALGGLAAAFAGMARALGAGRVVGTVRRKSLQSAQVSQLPYDTTIAAEDFPGTLDGERFDVIVDPVGGALRTASLDALAPLGRLLLVGNASDEWDNVVDTNSVWTRNIAIAGFSVGTYLPAHPALAAPAANAAVGAIRDGLLNLAVDVLPLALAGEAHRRLEQGPVSRRIVLTLDG